MATWYVKCVDSHIPAPPPMPIPPRLPAWYHPAALPFCSSLIVSAMKPPTGDTTSVAAICDNSTIMVNKKATSVLKGIKHKRISDNEHKLTPARYHLCKVSVRSVNGAQRNRQIFADTPNAVIPAAVATENPFCVNKKGIVTETKPELIPYGSTKKNTTNGAV